MVVIAPVLAMMLMAGMNVHFSVQEVKKSSDTEQPETHKTIRSSSTTMDLTPDQRSNPTFDRCAVGPLRPIRDEVLPTRRDGHLSKARKILASWRPLFYSLATLAIMALASGAKWRPR